MNAFYEVLDQLYKKVLLGATLESDSHKYVFYLNPALSDQECATTLSVEWPDTDGVQDRHQPPPVEVTATPAAGVCVKRISQTSSVRETKLLQLTVIHVMISRVVSVETEIHAQEKYRDITKILLHSAEVDCKLICLVQNSDRLLSHMAAKCLALLLYFQLKEKITLSSYWSVFCQKNLSEYSESNEVMHCLWILIAVIKEVFKDTCSEKAEILKQFLTTFDNTFEVFYSSLFSQHFENCQDPSKIVNSLVSFLDLLELLIASRIYLKLHFRSQRVLFLKPSCVLDILTWPIQAFVKRKLMIFIKKCLLCKVGEDLCHASVLVTMSPDHHLDVDMLALANAVLHTVNLGLLKTWSVDGKWPCFGGKEVHPGCGDTAGPDHVLLRAASLVIMKSLEIKFRNYTSVNEMKVDLQRFMSELLTFLKPHLQPSLQLHNPCEWLSRVFIEQDDDMLEAAKASLSIYLQLSREYESTGSLTQEKEMWMHHTHENGYNPHCIFIFFLKNIGFDSTVLLDFLISSETCFLEYFVRYLKLLQKDWDNFFTICKVFDATEIQPGMNICGCVPLLVQDQSSHQMPPFDGLTAPDSHIHAHTCLPWASGDSSELLKQDVMSSETHTTSDHSPPSPHASHTLVDYDSSDDSGAESMDQHVTNSQQTSYNPQASRKIQDPAGTSRYKKELSLQPQSSPLVPKQSAASFSIDCAVAPNNIVAEEGIFYRIVKCFEELQGAIYRLQTKNLFPYNPAALLKLLKCMEVIYSKSVSLL
ncbi:protein Lines homolog 1 [Fukomys damarensis]|uniref:protein Lines homolog 1 n=1 Tax=Fukomys damarensis TaxID=885580 RepID=UPI00054009D9|nr:protein Lines homolog 1 [Fukomys damarensis]XP_010609377.1 protein Lines homolog 1 [Fukomys damarensis]XP_010609378.1 protein Lines homolog 1 [Fukomys damarensis]